MGKKKSAKTKRKPKSLEERVGTRSKVYFLSEVAYDAHFFNEGAYQNLLRFMADDEDVSVLIDGPLLRVDRPEYLNAELTYWLYSEAECMEETDKVPNRRQLKVMRDKQLGILEQRLIELKEKVPNAKNVVLCIDSDDFQYTVSRMVNEMLLHKSAELTTRRKDLVVKRDQDKERHRGLKADFKKIAKVEGKSRERRSLKRKLQRIEARVNKYNYEIQDTVEQQQIYRENKTRPAHQFFTADFMRKHYRRYQDLCRKHGVKLIKKRSVINFDGLIVDYAHSRHATWGVLKSRAKALLGSIHGKDVKGRNKALSAGDREQIALEEQVFEELKSGAIKHGIDVIVESGHSGIGYKQLQKLHDHPDETNFRNQSSYDPVVGGEFMNLVMVLPFEDQKKIKRYLDGDEPERLSGGKGIGTRKHNVLDRMKHGGVSGVTAIIKDGEGNIATEWVQFQHFIDGTVLDQPDQYSFAYGSTDEHIGSPESNNMVQDGLVAIYEESLVTPSEFRGKPVFAQQYFQVGDAAEANSRKWNHRYKHRRNPKDVFRENLDLLKRFTGTPEEIYNLALKMTNDSMGGSVESMNVIMDWVADYFMTFLDLTLEHSDKLHAHASVTGNHADGVLRDLGLRESDFFVQRLKALGHSVYEVGKSNYYNNHRGDARVFVGGYENARILFLQDYNMNIDGSTPHGKPFDFLLQHDPKGSGFGGLIGAGKNAKADVSVAGHTHENWLKLYKTGDNKFGVAYRMAAMQGVSPTEKSYAASLPRTQAAHRIIVPMPGHFVEQALPAPYLQQKGKAAISQLLDSGPMKG